MRRPVTKKTTGLVFLVFFFAGGGTFADTLVAYWAFGPDAAGYTENVSLENADGVPTLSVSGTGYDADGQGGGSFVDAEGGSHAAGQALAWGSGVNDGDQEWVLSIDLTGYQDLLIRWDYRATGTGPTNAALDYKVGAGAWSSIETVSISNDSAYHAYEKDLSSIPSINNQSAVQFRLSGFSGGSGSGTFRTDNLQLSAIPEPAVVGFVGLSGLGLLIAKRFFDRD
ncbi:MAG: hypothetical protein U9P12_06205 [Verrucomicrobiota bacterium]|nr:hypothetical protein [Verrucomicrobiota bacterium]